MKQTFRRHVLPFCSGLRNYAQEGDEVPWGGKGLVVLSGIKETGQSEPTRQPPHAWFTLFNHQCGTRCTVRILNSHAAARDYNYW
jgi:hypothetical protein